MSSNLFNSIDLEEWTNSLDAYQTVLKLKASKITTSKTRSPKQLLELDEWYQTVLPGVIKKRTPKIITHDELCKLMKWKLTRGKFRPRLTELVQTNSEDDVVKASKKAFSKLPNVKEAISALTVLKAVGPATASAILSAGNPESTAFMADEAMLAIPGLQPLQYTLKHYLMYNDKIVECVKRLNKVEASKTWTAHDVELALWTCKTAEQLDYTSELSKMGKKRKHDTSQEESQKKKKTK